MRKHLNDLNNTIHVYSLLIGSQPPLSLMVRELASALVECDYLIKPAPPKAVASIIQANTILLHIIAISILDRFKIRVEGHDLVTPALALSEAIHWAAKMQLESARLAYIKAINIALDALSEVTNLSYPRIEK